MCIRDRYGTPIVPASSLTRSGTGPAGVPVCGSTRPCTGLVPRKTARSVPVGASVAAGDWADADMATKNTKKGATKDTKNTKLSDLRGADKAAWRIGRYLD